MKPLDFLTPVAMVNYHNTPFSRKEEFRLQMAWVASRFDALNAKQLADYHHTGRFPGNRPGIVIAFYNGYRNNFDVAFPVLQEFGLTGWFCVATDFLDEAPKNQLAFGREHTFNCLEGEYQDPRLALDWKEIKTLSAHGHEIVSHTASHSRVIKPDTDEAVARREIVHSANRIKEETGLVSPAFCWLYGEPLAGSPQALPLLREAGYTFLLGSQSVEYILGA